MSFVTHGRVAKVGRALAASRVLRAARAGVFLSVPALLAFIPGALLLFCLSNPFAFFAIVALATLAAAVWVARGVARAAAPAAREAAVALSLAWAAARAARAAGWASGGGFHTVGDDIEEGV